jgi:hypothetical protein
MSRSLRAVALTGLFLVLAASAAFSGYLAAPTQREGAAGPCRAALERIVAKEFAAHEVVEARLSLPAAIKRFRAINQADPGFSWDTFREVFPGATDDESLGRQVIQYASQELRDEPERADALVPRLNAELASYATPGQPSDN